jgi:hypothetical protein
MPRRAKKAHEEGFHFRKSSGKIPVSTLHKMLRKRIYTGEFDSAAKGIKVIMNRW